MTVKELKEQLADIPDDLEVTVVGGDYVFSDVTGVSYDGVPIDEGGHVEIYFAYEIILTDFKTKKEQLSR
jgi:hypothetical protein